ncbi:MAG: methylmalonyl Co-A mutase-associated GTPase MeaB [Dehalococcoidia bacterium]|nr:methylmalonyl Co-A mutase-associated GTPase MeaB [Dehalococcoidia bacterium]
MPMELVEKMLAGDERALARLITLVERDSKEVAQIMSEICHKTGQAYWIGVTGPPGSGKSTLVDRLTAVARSRGLTVGIIAVDPTSPFSGGAVLGDRIRMQQHYLDTGVFIRSMATRGSLGGLPRAARRVAKLLDAFGKDLVVLETVGVGQTELDIVESADTTVVVLYPGGGDAIQTMKAGLMEIANIFVVNKADRPGADQVVAELETMLSLNVRNSDWRVPVLTAQAVNSVGIEELYGAIDDHRRMLESTGQLAVQRRGQLKKELIQAIEQGVSERLERLMRRDDNLAQLLNKVGSGEIDPYATAQEILTNPVIFKKWLSRLEV